MPPKWFALLTMASFALSSNGCGTVCNLLSKEPKPYGGLATDAAVLGSMGPFPAGSGGKGALVLLAFCGCELCATGLADTLMLPYFYYRAKRDLAKARSAEDGDLPERYWDLPPQYSVGGVTTAMAPRERHFDPIWRFPTPAVQEADAQEHGDSAFHPSQATDLTAFTDPSKPPPHKDVGARSSGCNISSSFLLDSLTGPGCRSSAAPVDQK
jgi:uncharacterized protein YceK